MTEVWTIQRVLSWTTDYFRGKGVDTPRLDAEVLLGHVLKKERIYLYVHFDEPIEPAELAAFREAVKRRAAREPVAYIIGQKEFMGLPFKVTHATLVPRPDTEILVQAAVDALRGKPAGEAPSDAAAAGQEPDGAAGETPAGMDAAQPAGSRTEETPAGMDEAQPAGAAAPRFADIGTGTGAIALSVLHFVPEAEADAVDISDDALSVARQNAEALGLSARVSFFSGDLLAPLRDAGQRGYDAILSNPPYIPDADLAELAPEVRLEEPRLALAGGADGLDFYRRLAQEAPPLLRDGGFLAVEVGIGEAADVASLFQAAGLSGIEVRKDLGGIDRVVMAWKRRKEEA
jgi:release factor glutamine methyltransferase